MEATINSLHLILLIIIAIVFWRLRAVLGTHEDGPEKHNPALDDMSEQSQANPVLRVVTKGENPDAGDGLADIMKADSDFDAARFLQGAGQAYQMILTAYAENDRQNLTPLVSPDVLAGFEASMTERERQGYQLETKIISCDEPMIERAELDGRLARVTVQIRAELVSFIRDAAGEIIEGSPEQSQSTHDFWTFERDIKSRAPDWVLIATQTA
ncbi:MAG: Tim44/TimA family putative adaptor protein [Parvibaculales bacterium]